jgi:predicted ATP-grasp superfamily ATP-dependent carboligase
VQSEAELVEFCATARFPVLLKPRHQREWLALPQDNPLRTCKTISANSAQELMAHYSKVSAMVPEAVAQEEIVGADSAKYCYLSVYDGGGERLGACVVHELRAYPLLYGCATLVQPVVDDEIDTLCNTFLTSLGYIGICEIEVKRDARDGRVLLIEVNPRFSGTGDCAKYTGVETGFLHYLDLAGRTPPVATPTRFDFRHIMLCADLAAFPKYRQEGQMGWKDWLGSLSGPLEYFDFDLSDFSNARRTAVNGARALFGGLWRSRRNRC